MILGVIPARYASTRFPGKPLVSILGKSMIQRVYEQASLSPYLDKVIVATDDDRIVEHVKNFGGNVLMTSSAHASGTDRCFDVLSQLQDDYSHVVNIQGDEPFIDPTQINLLCSVLKDSQSEIATLAISVNSHDLLFNDGEVKIVINGNNEALYFSRMPIPFLKGVKKEEWHLKFQYYRHVGIYGYRSDVLSKLAGLQTSSLEMAESLEQLRWIENGYKIKIAFTEFDSHCIDTPEDIDRIITLMNLQ